MQQFSCFEIVADDGTQQRVLSLFLGPIVPMWVSFGIRSIGPGLQCGLHLTSTDGFATGGSDFRIVIESNCIESVAD